MRYFSSIIIISFFLGLLSCDKESISDPQTENFVKFYGAGLEDNGVRVITVTDGYLILGNIDNANQGKDICLIRTDKFGNSNGTILTYGGAFDDEAYTIVPNDSGYVIAGSTQRTASSDKDAFLIQIDKNGNELWNVKFDIAGNDEAYEAIILDDGVIALTGYTEDEAGDKDVLFIKYSRVGNLTVSKSYGLQSVDEEAFSIAYLGNNLYFFGGYKEANIAGQKSQKLLLLRWNEVTEVGVGINDSNIFTENTIARDITRSADGNLLVACNAIKENGESDILLIKMNDEVRQSEWTSSLGERTMNTVCCLKTLGNLIYLSGTSSNESEIGDMVIVKMDQNGLSPEYIYRGDGETYSGSGFDFTSNGGYVITGANFVNKKSLITIFKIDPNGSF